MTGLSAAIEALVGASCLAMSWGCWKRGTALFRGVGIVLAAAGLVAIANATMSLFR